MSVDYPVTWHEKIAVALVLSGTLIMAFFSYQTASYPLVIASEAPLYLLEPEVVCTVSGAVKKPGRYKVKRGESLNLLLLQAEPLPEADLSRYDLEKSITKPVRIKVPVKKVFARTSKKRPS